MHAAYSDPDYIAAKRDLEDGATWCHHCGRAKATVPDHVPPVSEFPEGAWEGILVPSCARCNRVRGAQHANRRMAVRRARTRPVRSPAKAYPPSSWAAG